MNMDGDDQYIKQLQQIFNEFCSPRSSGINKEQLLALCNRLSLDGKFINQLFLLAFSKDVYQDDLISSSSEKIEFDQFCEYFISVLTKLAEPIEPNSYSTNEVENEGNVTPRLVRGGRRYGRKSLPHSSLSEDVKNVAGFCDNVPAVENGHWSSEMLTSSDENEEPIANTRQLYYEPGFGVDDPENSKAVAENQSFHPLTKRHSSVAQVLCSSDNVDSELESAPTSSLFQENSELNLFSKFVPDSCDVSSTAEPIIELWKKAGIAEPAELLRMLGFSSSEEELIDGVELTVALEKAVLSGTSLPTQSDSPFYTLLVCALVTSYKSHMLHVNFQAEQYKLLTEKMRDDLERSELRTSKLIDEADDHYLSMDQQTERRMSVVERKWAKKINSLQQGHKRERESIVAQFNQDKEALRAEIDALRASDDILRRKLQQARTDNDSLTRESAQLCEKLSEAEKDADRLRKDLECLMASKLNDASDPVNTSQEEKFAMIIKEYEAQCRHLADRNDELVVEVEALRNRICQLESTETRADSIGSFRDEKLRSSLSPKRKKAHKRHSSLSDHCEQSATSCSDMESDAVFDFAEKHKSKLGKNDKQQAYDHASIRMAELERLVDQLRDEKRTCVDNFANEKAKLRTDLEKDFQIQLANEKAKLCNLDDNRAVEEQHNMTMRLLKEITSEKDEIEAKYKELKETVEERSSSNQQGMADLCREFANEKAELVSQHEEKIEQLDSKIEDLERQLAEERKAVERLSEQLKNERLQHKEALVAHQEVIDKFEKAAANNDSRSADASSAKCAELTEKFQSEARRIKSDHAAELLSVKRQMQEKLDQLLSEKQKAADCSSVCSELERLEESLVGERKAMHEKMQQMREAFQQEAHELKRLLDSDKAKLRKQLNEEVAALRQRLAEETEKEVKRKKQAMEENEYIHKLNAAKQERESLECRNLQEKVKDLKSRNEDLEQLLSKASANLKALESENIREIEARGSCDTWQLEERISEMNSKLMQKEQENLDLRKQVDDLLHSVKEKTRLVSSLQSSADICGSETSQLKRENDELLSKVRDLERDKHDCRVENAGLLAKCERLEKSDSNSSSTTPKPKRRLKIDDEHLRRMNAAEAKVSEMSQEIADLNARLAQAKHPSDPRSRSESRSPPVVSPRGGDHQHSDSSSASLLRSRLDSTRTQLNDQMRRSKDLYSKLAKSETLVKELYCENSQLMRALQLTESRQKEAERRCQDEKDRAQALGRLLKKVCPDVV